MGEVDGGLKDLMMEAVQLVGRIIKEGMESEGFQREFDEINQRIADRYGRFISGLGFGIEVMMMAVGERGQKSGEITKPAVRINFDEKEDAKFLRDLKIKADPCEIAEFRQALKSTGTRKGKPSLGPPLSKPRAAGKGMAKPSDPRSVSQIINSIREIARALSFYQRFLLIESLSRIEELKCLGITISEEQARDNRTWLQYIQNIIGEIQKVRGAEAKEALIAFESVLDMIRDVIA